MEAKVKISGLKDEMSQALFSKLEILSTKGQQRREKHYNTATE